MRKEYLCGERKDGSTASEKKNKREDEEKGGEKSTCE